MMNLKISLLPLVILCQLVGIAATAQDQPSHSKDKAQNDAEQSSTAILRGTIVSESNAFKGSGESSLYKAEQAMGILEDGSWHWIYLKLSEPPRVVRADGQEYSSAEMILRKSRNLESQGPQAGPWLKLAFVRQGCTTFQKEIDGKRFPTSVAELRSDAEVELTAKSWNSEQMTQPPVSAGIIYKADSVVFLRSHSQRQ